jgi:hypothetical protein
VAKQVGFMFDKYLTKWPDVVPISFSSENPPPEVRSFIVYDYTFFWHLQSSCLQSQGAYPEFAVDIVLFIGDEARHSPATDVPTNLKVPAADDNKNVGAISAEATAPSPTEADAHE